MIIDGQNHWDNLLEPDDSDTKLISKEIQILITKMIQLLNQSLMTLTQILNQKIKILMYLVNS